jgi:glutathione S-transferase
VFDGLTLKYWNGRGLMEIAGIMLAKKNMYAENGDYADVRVTTDSLNDYEKANNTVVSYKSLENTLDANLGRLPILECNGKSVGQSTAFNYFVAKKLNLFGDNDMESSRIMSVLSTLDELKSTYRKVIPYGVEPGEEALAKFFGEPERDVHGPAVRSNRDNRLFRWFCGRMEHSLCKESKWAVGSRMSLADIAIYRELNGSLLYPFTFACACLPSRLSYNSR